MTEQVAARGVTETGETERRRDTAVMGMMVFLASEIMLFGGIVAVALTVRYLHPEAVVEASRKMHVWIGAANTLILLASSLLVAIAVSAAEAGRGRATAWLLAGAAALGVGFLGLKAIEYILEYQDRLLPGFPNADFSGPVERLWMDIYLVATSLHALHLTIGIAVVAGLAIRVRLGSVRLPGRAVTVETVGLYWHLVDVIWVFLYPILYLAR